MANVLTPVDVHTIVNEMSKEMFGQEAALKAVDTTTFATIGEKMLRTGYTNTLNALGMVLGRTVYAVRPYQGRFKLIMKLADEWGGYSRKISFYAKGLEMSKNANTDIDTGLIDYNTVDHYTISKKYPLELNFYGIKLEQYSDTTWLSQLKQAFQSEAEFGSFVAAKLVDIANDIESKTDAENRLLVLNAIGATYNTGAARSKVNLTAAFNAKYGTSYTTTQLQTTYLKEFTAFMVAKMKSDMELMRERNELFHIYPAKKDDSNNDLALLRYTPPERRRLLLYMPLIRDEETAIFPSLFNDSYVKLENYESVEYWQNPNAPMAVNVKPNQLNITSGAAEDGTAVSLTNVVAFLFDDDALGVSIKHESALTTPVNAAGEYYNTFYHWAYQFKVDQTENMILYYMAD